MFIWSVRSVWFVLFIWLNQTNQIDQINQVDQTEQSPAAIPRGLGVGTLWRDYFAIVMLGTPTRGTSVTVIWNKRYSNWKASRFQRAMDPVPLTA